MRPTPSQPPIARDRLVQLLDRMKSRRIVVIGDVMLDRYLLGDTHRLSPEAPVPVITVRETRSALGGAANVAANVAAIGASCRLVGAVGDDSHAGAIRAELAASRLEDKHLVQVSGRPTTTKTRVLARNQQIVRIDEEIESPLEGQDQERLISTALAALVDADALVLEDYNKGALTEPLITASIAAARRRGIPVVVDPKFRNFFAFAGATVFKPNRRELEAAMGAAVDLEHPEALPATFERLGVDHLLLTLGERGMALIAADGLVRRIPTTARDVYDVVGAGDTVTAYLATSLAAGASAYEAAVVANYAAGVEVGKLGAATVTPDEIREAYEGHQGNRE
jgi:D-beta-D-heptose 7-phosphate kinase/D-beta-D-heptose 1-phosphate adenosyltransferase